MLYVFEDTEAVIKMIINGRSITAMPCKTSKNSQHGATRGKSNEIKSKLACILEDNESTRMRMGNSIPHYHQDHIAGKGENS